MADGFLASLSHVPQQSRRDKLRVLSQHQQPNPFPVYDPSFLHVPADLMTCPSSFPSLVKEEASSSLLRFPINRCALPDPQPSLPENPNHIQDSNPAFLCAQHELRSSREWGYPSLGGNFTSASDGTSGQGLSLSLSSRVNRHGNDDQRCLPFELNLERYGSVAVYGGEKGGGSTYLGEVPRGSGPLGPFMGYSLILRGSRFLKPAQKLLEELCDVGRGLFYAERVADEDSGLMEGGGECFSHQDDRRGVGSGDGGELWGRKSRLMSMLDEVCRRYMQYYQQLQDVVASFECVAGLGNAAPFVNLALKAMSKHFKRVKDAIMDQLQFTSKAHRKPSDTKDDIAGLGTNERLHIGQRAIRNSGYLQQRQPVWRPQRGLPERAVAVLRAWLFEHFLHPYPTDTDKLMLAKQTGLSRCQVSNWFINARVRLWKPMVEEIHTLEMQQKHASQMTHRDEKSETQTSNDQAPESSSAPSASVSRIHATPQPARRTVGALTSDSSTVRNEQMHYLSHVMPGKSIGRVTSGGVTLTLGLHQQNAGLGAVQRLGPAVEATGEGHQVTGGYELQDRQFSRDVYGGHGHGQILNDFVG